MRAAGAMTEGIFTRALSLSLSCLFVRLSVCLFVTSLEIASEEVSATSYYGPNT